MDTSRSPTLAPGTIVADKYRLVRAIGAGGMGEIWSAVNVVLNQPVALKMMRAEVRRDDQAVTRFLREGRAAARLRSAHVARVLDCGTLEDGSIYLVSELLEGHDLAMVARASGPLAIADAVDLVMQACDGIAEAHANGIIHRDLKPANLFLTETVSGRPLVKVLDFGICKLDAAPNEPLLTRTNEILGTPRYMSPEQLLGLRDVDARADVWALGVILYELLTKAPPFDGPDIGDLMRSILQDEPPPIQTRRMDIPPELAGIVHRALAKDREGRFTDAVELALALAPYGNGRRPSTPLRLQRERSEAPPARDVETSRLEARPSVAPRRPAPVERESPAAAPPVRVGDYLMFGPLGRGGMAVVHYGCARRPDGSPEIVALKRLRSDLTDSNALTMFSDEARLASSIRHPNVVATRDVVDDGATTLVLEYVPGVCLADVLDAGARPTERDRRPVPVAVAAAIAIDALRGLDAAHTARDPSGAALEIVHRDVSPQNILVSEDGTTKLTDFGIAMARHRLQRTTETGAFKGKLGYLAPEQIHGKASRASDVYALGAVLWEMLVGHPLHQGSDGEMLAAALVGRTSAPSKNGAPCSPALDAIVLRALARDPEQRPRSAAEMADAVAGATGVASRAEVAAWLAAAVGPSLERRRSDVRAVLAAAVATPPQHVAPALPAPAGTSGRVIALVGGLSLAAVVLLGVGWHFGARPAGGTTPTPSSAPARIAEPEPVASTPVVASAPPPATTTEPPPPPSAAPTTGNVKRTPKGQTAVKPAPDCSVPYAIDAQGHQIWRRECFKK